jgi:hypothetical protein
VTEEVSLHTKDVFVIMCNHVEIIADDNEFGSFVSAVLKHASVVQDTFIYALLSLCCRYLSELEIFVTSHILLLSVSAFCCLLLYLATALHVLVMSNLWPVNGG